MRRLLKQRLLTVQPGLSPILHGGFGAMTIVAEDRPDVQVVLSGLGLRRIPEWVILDPTTNGYCFVRCDRLWEWGALVRAVTVRVPRDFAYLIQAYTRGRITTTGPIGRVQLTAFGRIRVEEIPTNSTAVLSTKGWWSSIKVGKTSGELSANTNGGSVQVEAAAPSSLTISPKGGNVDVHGDWDDRALWILGECWRETLRKST
ncbi:hypothetical protein AB0H37_03830 [Actinomadura sp. NPDC023710]|uniref:hypothetical protein n=1 Tax=Actinomadura sp. NPDC023710 TaxID=3158219 RepID=UPI00340DDE07